MEKETPTLTRNHNTETRSDAASRTTSTQDAIEVEESSLLMQAFATGSIASSCCLFQLGLNLLSYLNIMHVGCAGFNSMLGPLRPYTRTMTISWLLWNWVSFSRQKASKCCSQRRSKRLVLSSILCITLMFMPELLGYIGNSGNKVLLVGGGSKPGHLVRMEYVVDNMGCEACINAVERLITGQDGVAKSKVASFDSGQVEIYVDGEWDAARQTEFELSLDLVLNTHGYELHPKGWVTKKMKMASNEHIFG